MISEMKQLQLTGAKFDHPTNLALFAPGEANKILKGTLVYGRNGSGKSTIARGFRLLSGETLPAISVSALNEGGIR